MLRQHLRTKAALGLLVICLLGIGTVAPSPAAAEGAVVNDSKTVADFAMVAELDELTGDHATVFRLYWAFFLRNPDGPGALYWIERQERCQSLASITDSFAEGEEFLNRYGRLSDEAFVERIYTNVLGRTGDQAGLRYWTDLVVAGELSRGEMVLYVSMSDEFRTKHPYPSDGVPGRGCRLPEGLAPTPRGISSIDVTEALPLAKLSGVSGFGPYDFTVAAPAPIIELAGFHQSVHPGALPMRPVTSPAAPTFTMGSRNRGTHRRGAIDVAVHPLVPISAPVEGRVARAGNYVLYCRYRDGYVVINPVGRPELEVKILHITDVSVSAGDWVSVGDNIAARATPFPFRSQLDKWTSEPSWPHVHIETVDPSIPRKPSSGGGC